VSESERKGRSGRDSPREGGGGSESGRRKVRRLRERAVRQTRHKWMRSRVVDEWRGIGEPPSATKNLKAMDQLIPEIIGALGLKERYETEEMEQVWRELVGDFNASLSRPVRIDRRVLYVQIAQPTALYHMERTLKPELLKKIQAKFGAERIRDIRFTG
jgi:predicted nucleic acid-binding Zn ribbon protein